MSDDDLQVSWNVRFLLWKQGLPQAWKEMGIEPVERPGLTRREEVDDD